MISAGEVDYLLAVSEDQIAICERMMNSNSIIIKPSERFGTGCNSKM